MIRRRSPLNRSCLGKPRASGDDPIVTRFLNARAE